jgi:HlyD family secretion protein
MTAESSAQGGVLEGAVPSAQADTSRRRTLLIVGAIVLVVAGVLIWRVFFATPGVPKGVVALSGRIEGDDSAIAPKTGGRVLEVRVREGDIVQAGDILAILDDDQVRAREMAAQAVLNGAEAQAHSAHDQIAILQEQVRQNEMLTSQSKNDADGKVRQAQSDLAAAEADLAQQQAAFKIASFDKDAYTKLAKTGAVSERQGLQAASTADQQAAAVAAAQKRVDAAQGALTTAKANLDNPDIHSAQVEVIRQQINQQQSQIADANANIAQARAQLAEAEDNRNDLTVKAPFTGTIVTRAAEPGEVIAAGTAVLTMVDLTKVYLRGFVPEGQIGAVKVGQSARVYLDSDPKKPLDAFVSRVDPQATFTPENTYFRDDRVKQVVGVKLELKEAFGYAKPGMPADGEILVSGGSWPNK